MGDGMVFAIAIIGYIVLRVKYITHEKDWDIQYKVIVALCELACLGLALLSWANHYGLLKGGN